MKSSHKPSLVQLSQYKDMNKKATETEKNNKL